MYQLDVIISCALFLSIIIACMVFRVDLAYALLFGFIIFFILAVIRGHKPKQVAQMALNGVKSCVFVLRILLMLGCLTALWRSSGTIAYFVYWGIELSTPTTFLLIAFLLPATLCLAMGSSFGVSGTAGVILMAIAHSGGANLVLTAGAALSGAYFGERISPASSIANLTASVCGADLVKTQKMMWRSTLVPLIASIIFYAILAYYNPIDAVDPEIPLALASTFELSPLLLLPALVLVLSPWLKIPAFWSIMISCIVTIVLAMTLQAVTFQEIMYQCIYGFQLDHPVLGDILRGGGVVSMLSVLAIVSLSTGYCGILTDTHLLDGVKKSIQTVCEKYGLFPTLCFLGFATPALFCNQAVSVVMCGQMTKDVFDRKGYSSEVHALYLSNSVINLSGMVPWAISCSVPLTNMGASAKSVPYAVYLYFVPIYYGFLLWREQKNKPITSK